MKLILIIVIYVVGVLVWMKLEKRYNPWEEGEYHLEFDGAHLIDPELHNEESVMRSVLWPLCLVFLVVLSPILIFQWIWKHI